MRIDQEGKKGIGWYLTGSREPALMKGVTESMAGRAAVFHLLPLSTAESSRISLLLGGFPEIGKPVLFFRFIPKAPLFSAR